MRDAGPIGQAARSLPYLLTASLATFVNSRRSSLLGHGRETRVRCQCFTAASVAIRGADPAIGSWLRVARAASHPPRCGPGRAIRLILGKPGEWRIVSPVSSMLPFSGTEDCSGRYASALETYAFYLKSAMRALSPKEWNNFRKDTGSHLTRGVVRRTSYTCPDYAAIKGL